MFQNIYFFLLFFEEIEEKKAKMKQRIPILKSKMLVILNFYDTD